MIVLALLFAVTVSAPQFHWESPPGVEYVELVCNGVSIGWRLAADGVLTPRAMDFPAGDYSCIFRAYDALQVFIEETPPFTFTVAPQPSAPVLQLR